MFSNLSPLWADQRFRRLIGARLVSNFGNGVAPIALAFGVLSLPGATATSLSLVAASQAIPIVVFLLVGGVVADVMGRARMVGGTDLLGSILVTLNGVLFIVHHASVIQLCVTGFCFGILNALWYPAFSGLLPQLVPPDLLQPANSLVGFSGNIGFSLGAAAAGILVPAFGAGWVIIIDGVSFLVAGILVWQLRDADQPQPLDRSRTSLTTHLKQGWWEFTRRRWLVVIAFTFSMINMCFEAFLAVLAPLRMKEALGGVRDMSYMMFAWGIGSAVGVFFSVRVRTRRPLITAMAVIPAMSLWMVSLALPMHMMVIMVFALFTGIAVDIFYVLWTTAVQTNVPGYALSRVGSIDAFASNITVPIGLLLAGPLAATMGARAVILLAAALVLILCGVSVLSRDVRHLRPRDVARATEDSERPDADFRLT